MRFPTVVAPYSHKSHWNLLCWMLICFLRRYALVVVYLHWVHGNLTPSCILCMCFLRSDACLAEYSHWLQGYLTPSCMLCMCLLRFPWFVALYSHREQGYLTPSCFLFLVLSWSGSSISSKNTYIKLSFICHNIFAIINRNF